MSPLARCAVSAAVVVLSVAGAGCEDSKASEETAVQLAAKLAGNVEEAVQQPRKGLPAGSQTLGTKFAAELGSGDLQTVQKAIQASRASVPDLDRAKSTFFAFADPNGTVVRSEADPDLLAGANVFKAFPDLKKAADPGSGVVELYGEMNEMRGLKTGADLAWVLAHPVKDKDGAVKGVFITGWSFRRFAAYLEDQARRELFEKAQEQKAKAPPLAYAFVIKGGKAYGTPVTPDVNAEAVEKLDLVGKTAGGPWRGSVEITKRMFGVAAQRTPGLGDDAAVAVLVSGI